MPKKLTLTLKLEQQLELVRARDTHEKPYIRERAAALVKIACGQDYKEVAATGLLSTYCRQAVASWVKRYEQEGLDGLFVKAGRGRKAVFFSGTQNLGSGARRIAASGDAYAGKRRAKRQPLVAQADSRGLSLAQRTRREYGVAHPQTLQDTTQARARTRSQP